MKIEREEKDIWEIIILEEKTCWIRKLWRKFEELENASLNKYIFKYFKSIKKVENKDIESLF